ncbi:MAG: glycosyltransferase [Anaerolineales bacterium]|nr:glycosyltransferase [Anaerolineales bacterium]
MRVLIISHTYFPAIYRGKLRHLARLPDVELQLAAIPSAGQLHYEHSPDDVYPQHLLPSWPAAHNILRIYSPLALGLIMSRLRPDIVHIESEPHALSLTQVVLMRILFGYRIMFFTWENLQRTLPWPARLVERFNVTQADAAIAGNQEAAHVLRRRGFRGPIAVVPQVGVDLAHCEHASPASPWKDLRANGPVIGFAGRMVREKGVPDLLEAIARLPSALNAQLLLVGAGTLESELAVRAEQLGLGARVHRAGSVPFDRVAAHLKCMDVLVLPSRTMPKWKEQFGHVLVEAMACGVPVIGSDSGAIPEVIGEAGLIFPEGDVSALTDRLQRLLNDTHLRRTLSEQGRRRVAEHFSDAIVAERTYAAYRQLCPHG